MLSLRFVVYLAAFACASVFWSTSVHAQDDQAVPDTETVAPSVPTAEQSDLSLSNLQILMVPMTGADLAGLAEVWQAHLKAALQETALISLSLDDLDDAAADTARTRIAEAREGQKDIQTNYSAVLDAWTAKGGTVEDLAPHRAYMSALAIAAVQATDARTLATLAMDWAKSWDGGLGTLSRLAGFVVALWVLMIVARVFRRAATRGVDRIPNLSRLLKKFIATAVYWATFVFGILIVLGLFGINVTPLFAVFGGLSFILGFALQDTLGNLASGLMIMVLKPFDTGDYIEVGGSSGFVDEMSIVSTRIRTFDNQIIVVPNSKIWGDVITNVSASPERRVDLVFGIGYTDKAQHAIDVLKDLIAAHPMCLKNPEPEVFVGELGDSSVNIFCRPWSKSDDYWTVYWDLTGHAKERFDSEGISIPFPQRDVHLITANSDQSEPA